jgi:hypothetical protein
MSQENVTRGNSLRGKYGPQEMTIQWSKYHKVLQSVLLEK